MPAAAATSAMLACSPRSASTAAAASRIAPLTRACSVVCLRDISVSFRVCYGSIWVCRSHSREPVSSHETWRWNRMLKYQPDDEFGSQHIDEELSLEELRAETAEALPERAAMSTVNLAGLDAASGTVEAVTDGVSGSVSAVNESGPPPAEPVESATGAGGGTDGAAAG